MAQNIVLIIEGGVIHNVLTDSEDVNVFVLDYDTEGSEEELIHYGGHDACAYQAEVEINPQEVSFIKKNI